MLGAGLLLPTPAAAADASAEPAGMARVHDLANQCRTLGSVEGSVATDDDAWGLDVDGEPLFLEPTDLGVFLLQDRDERLLAAATDPLSGPTGELVRSEAPSPEAEWQLAPSGDDAVTLTNLGTGEVLVADDAGLRTDDAADGTAFVPTAADDCTPWPEVDPGASGEPFRGTLDDGTVLGFADTHTHVAAFLRLGGGAIHGEPYHRYGVATALRDGAELHGPDGSADVLGNILRTGTPVGTHATDGWPTFTDWPTHDTYTHQQSYWVWLQRVWLAGLRLMVVHVNADEQLCLLLPNRDRSRDCDEMESARLQLDYLAGVERYVDAQSGGPGEGFFQIVTDPVEARRVIEEGKVAVVLGIESSKLFGCGEADGVAECDESDVDAGIAEFHDRGVRSLFLAHWFDNAFGGPGIFAQSEVFLNALNKLETGHYYRVEQCPEPDMGHDLASVGAHQDPESSPVAALTNDAQLLLVPTYGPGPHCNVNGLTDLGAYAVEQMAEAGFVIETDHLSAKARSAVLDIAERIGHPVVSGHFHAGGLTTEDQFRRILAVGGIAGPINPPYEEFAETVRGLEDLADPRYAFGVPIATDTGGLASLPGPLGDDVVDYPFTSWAGDVVFERQRTGDREFDVNRDGVAHYGLYADWLAAIAGTSDGENAMRRLFSSAEAWLQMWSRVVAEEPDGTPGADGTPETGDSPSPVPVGGTAQPGPADAGGDAPGSAGGGRTPATGGGLGVLALAAAATATRRRRTTTPSRTDR